MLWKQLAKTKQSSQHLYEGNRITLEVKIKDIIENKGVNTISYPELLREKQKYPHKGEKDCLVNSQLSILKRGTESEINLS